jgi:hypothetical protein
MRARPRPELSILIAIEAFGGLPAMNTQTKHDFLVMAVAMLVVVAVAILAFTVLMIDLH